jgi:hypothetical protein
VCSLADANVADPVVARAAHRRRKLEPMKDNSCRAAERRARLAIIDIANAEDCNDAARLRALARLSAVIDGYILEIGSRNPKPKKGEEIYI